MNAVFYFVIYFAFIYLILRFTGILALRCTYQECSLREIKFIAWIFTISFIIILTAIAIIILLYLFHFLSYPSFFLILLILIGWMVLLSFYLIYKLFF